MPTKTRLQPGLPTLLRQLKNNNNREWFQKNKDRYEADVRDPLLRFIEAFGPRLHKITRTSWPRHDGQVKARRTAEPSRATPVGAGHPWGERRIQDARVRLYLRKKPGSRTPWPLAGWRRASPQWE